MAPHCDSMDGPVVRAAQAALDAGDVTLILPYVPKEGEAEVLAAFGRATSARAQGPVPREVADLYFFDNVVRIHRAGEGAPYTGLKPAGQDYGPILPAAERAIETGAVEVLASLLAETVARESRARFDRLMALKPRFGGSVNEARAYVEAMLDLEVYANNIYTCAMVGPHESHHQLHAD